MKAIKIIFILFLPLTLLLSCSSASEKNGLNEIASIWGPTSITKGFSTSTSDGSGKYVELKVSNPGFFEKNVKLEPIARGVAFLFFKNLTPEEQSAYAKYSIVLKNDSGRSETFSYPSKVVLDYFEKEKIANTYYTKLLQGDFNYIYNNLDNTGNTIPMDTLVNTFNPLLKDVKDFDKVATNKIFMTKITMQDERVVEGIGFEGNIMNGNSVIKYFSVTIDKARGNKIIAMRYWEN